MFKVKSKRSGNVYTVYGIIGCLFVLWKDKRWVFEPMEHYEPV